MRYHELNEFERALIEQDLDGAAREDGPVNHTVLEAILASAIEDKEMCWEHVKGYDWTVFLWAALMLMRLKRRLPQAPELFSYETAAQVIRRWAWRAVRARMGKGVGA